MLLIPIRNFERKLKIRLNLSYFLHLFRILAIICCSKFQLIQNWFFFKGNSILYNFYRNREIQISTFFRPKMRFKLLLKIIMVSKHFSFFLFKFSWSYLQKFSKKQIRCHKEKHFFYYFLKNEIKMKSNKKSHLINFKLILVRTNQN